MSIRVIIIGLMIIYSLSLCLPKLTIAESGQTVTVNTHKLNARTGPGLSYEILKTLSYNSTYNLIQEKGNWIQIEITDHQKAWVANWLVVKNPASSFIRSKQAEQAVCLVDELRVRSGPGTNFSTLFTLQQGEEVTIVKKQHDWVNIETETGTGWVSISYLKRNKPLNHATPTSVTILFNHTNIRKEANTASPIIGKANKGESYKVIQVLNSWYQIELANGQTGFIAEWIVSAKTHTEETNANPLQGKVIVLDPGHGGRDIGTKGIGGTFEKNLNWRTGKLLYDKLARAGAEVFFTREEDEYISLNSRVLTSSFYNADAYISIHYDSGSNSATSGMTSYFYTEKQRLLAEAIQEATVEETGSNDRGARFGDYFVLRENTQVAVLLELGYLSNPTEETLVETDSYQAKAVDGIVQGMENYFKQ